MIPKRVFWFAAGAAAGAFGIKRVESALEARRDQLTPANLATGAAGMLVGVAADAPGRVTGLVKERRAQRGDEGSGPKEPWAPRDWSSDGGAPGRPAAPLNACAMVRPGPSRFGRSG